MDTLTLVKVVRSAVQRHVLSEREGVRSTTSFHLLARKACIYSLEKMCFLFGRGRTLANTSSTHRFTFRHLMFVLAAGYLSLLTTEELASVGSLL